VKIVGSGTRTACSHRTRRRSRCTTSHRRPRLGAGLGYPAASLVNRYYDPSTAQFLSVDPLVAETGQPFAYADDDPVNGSDPSGLITCGGFWGWVPGCGTITDVQNGISGATNSAGSAVTNELQTIDCNAVGGGNSIFNGTLGCAGDSNGPVCTSPFATTVYPNYEDGAKAPGPGWVWKGTGTPSSNKGSWVNPVVCQSHGTS
jgi:uncharacterized protein RhaS with RHS repeats